MKRVSTCVVAGVLALGAARAGAADDAIRQFDFGAYHRCAVTAAGAVQCLGESNVFGQVGDGHNSGDQRYPRPVTAIAQGASKVVTGSFFSCAIIKGALRCWGDVGKGKADTPRTLIGSGVSDAAAGDDRVCAIVGDAAQCVGAGGNSGSQEYQTLHPAAYTEIEHGVRAIAAGHQHACAVAGDAVLCWGDVPFDASGRGERMTRTATPRTLIAHGAGAVASGADHDCAIVDGAVWCWGDNTYGQVGVGVDAAHAKASAAMPAPNQLASFDDGAQRCFGNVGTVEHCWVSRPVRVIEGGATRVFAKDHESCALLEGGTLQCWGENSFGQLGGGAEHVLSPLRVIDRGVTEAMPSANRTCALRDGALQCSRSCVRNDGSRCRPPLPGFDAQDLAFGLSQTESRLGVWRGSLGTQPIMLCLQRSPVVGSSYYYLRHRATIALRNEDMVAARWYEGVDEAKSSGDWQLDVAQGDRMSGIWSDPEGNRELPIRLTRVPTKGDPGEGCGESQAGPQADAYNAPRVEAEKLETTSAADGTRTVKAHGDQLSIVELPDSVQNAAAFNAAMRAWLREQIVGYFDCASWTTSEGQVDFNQQRRIELRAGNWVVVAESSDLFCGGAHPSGGVVYQTWNLELGKTIEPWSWIRDGKLKCDYSTDCGYGAPDKLNAIILAKATRNKDGDECADAVNENRSYGLRPSSAGLVFATAFAHAIQACDEDIELSLAEVSPFLTVQGKAELKSLIDAASTVPEPAKPAASQH